VNRRTDHGRSTGFVHGKGGWKWGLTRSSLMIARLFRRI
jgi:hypothetical protein